MSFYRRGPAGGKLEVEVSELPAEQEVERLFGLAPEAFVAARDQLARQLRRDGDAEAAARVKALRRPPLSAWAVNQLARNRGRQLARLLDAGERLRAAHQAALAGGGADELRAAARAERQAVAGLVEAALETLREAGHPTTDATRERVVATLHAAAADPEAADLVRSGRLTSDLAPSGFGTALAAGGPVPAASPPKAKRRANGDAKAGPARALGDTAARAREDDTAAAAPEQEDDPAAARARRQAAVTARDEARKRARLAADQAVLATRHAERLGRLADQAEREATRARAAAQAAIEAAAAARERAARAAKNLREAEDRIPADR
jgi:hypothetical protein